MSHMERIGVRELRQNASKYLKRAEAGESIEVTDRGRPVARLVPATAGADIDQLVAEGLLIPPQQPGDILDLGPPIPLKPGTRLPSELVSELRDH